MAHAVALAVALFRPGAWQWISLMFGMTTVTVITVAVDAFTDQISFIVLRGSG